MHTTTHETYTRALDNCAKSASSGLGISTRTARSIAAYWSGAFGIGSALRAFADGQAVEVDALVADVAAIPTRAGSVYSDDTDGPALVCLLGYVRRLWVK